MLEPQDSRFWRVALQTGLIVEPRLRACWDEIPPEKRTTEAIDRRLARRVIETGLLTRWQAQQLLAGVRPQGLHYNKYVIEDLIGQGGMGRVYLAHDRRLHRRVALKVLSRERMNNPRALARFRREARIGAQLQHDNLVRIYDAGEEGGQHFLVMEYIEGKNLGRMIAERGPLPSGLAARIARQVALGLEHARQKGLVHRDVNPMNILLDRDGTAKLTDLGLAIDLNEAGEVVTRDGATVGTFDYISPEQARHSRSIDIRSDIYSLGCSLYHMLTGRVPFRQPSLPEKLYAHQMLEPEPISSIVEGVPPGLVAIVAKMMAKEPEYRFATPQEVARALEPYQCGQVRLDEIESTPEVPVLIDADVSPEPEPEPVPEQAVELAEDDESTARCAEQGLDGGNPLGIAVELANRPESPAGVALVERPEVAIRLDTNHPEPTPSTPRSDDFAIFPPIDIGPEAGLSDSLTIPGPAASEGPSPSFPIRPITLGILLLLVVAAVVWNRRDKPSGMDEPILPPPRITQSPPTIPPVSLPVTAVRRLGSPTEEEVPNLKEGLRLAVDKPAEVVLRNTEPLVVPTSEVHRVNGRLVLRAGEGARPVLDIQAGRTRPFLEVGAAGSLRLVGLTIHLNAAAEASSSLSIIESLGGLELENCEIRLVGSGRATPALRASGRILRVINCHFCGFDSPIQAGAVASSTVEIRNTLIVRDEKPSEEPSDWALEVEHQSVGGSGERTIRVEHCTVVGLGLLAIHGLDPGDHVAVEVLSTVVRGPALLEWDGGEPFPNGLTWIGRENLFAIGTRGPWVRVKNPREGLVLPNDLASWVAAVGTEEDSESRAARFTASPGAPIERLRPADFTLVGQPGRSYGIDAGEVGP